MSEKSKFETAKGAKIADELSVKGGAVPELDEIDEDDDDAEEVTVVAKPVSNALRDDEPLPVEGGEPAVEEASTGADDSLGLYLRQMGAIRLLNKDEIRHALFPADEIDYSSRQDDFCLRVMLETAGYLLQRDPNLILFLDGRTFSRRYQIDNVLAVATTLRQSWRILECVCPEEVARQRIERQSAAETHPAGNRDFNLYREVVARFEFITLPKTVIDTSQPFEVCVEQALAALR